MSDATHLGRLFKMIIPNFAQKTESGQKARGRDREKGRQEK